MTLTYPAEFPNNFRGGCAKIKNQNGINKIHCKHDTGQPMQSTSSDEYPWAWCTKQKNSVPKRFESESHEKKESLWQLYCKNSTIHGFRYIADKSVHWFERLTMFETNSILN